MTNGTKNCYIYIVLVPVLPAIVFFVRYYALIVQCTHRSIDLFFPGKKFLGQIYYEEETIPNPKLTFLTRCCTHFKFRIGRVSMTDVHTPFLINFFFVTSGTGTLLPSMRQMNPYLYCHTWQKVLFPTDLRSIYYYYAVVFSAVILSLRSYVLNVL